ncbi:hypothetical protein PAXRUDRAFT_154520, partial [Paxillus rubicundulus Ve08.2h10]
YPHPSHMVLNYLSIPATSIDVKYLFSHGHLILSHTHTQLSVQSIYALLCLGIWSELSLIKDDNVTKVISLLAIEGEPCRWLGLN